MNSQWARAAVVVAAVWTAAVGCGAIERGANDEDRHRLATLRDDPAASLEPVGVVTGGPLEEFLATTDNGQLAGCCDSGVGGIFTTSADPDDVISGYVDDLVRLDWTDVLVECLSLTTQVSALKRFDTFVGRFRVEVSLDGPPHRLFQSLEGRFHTGDYPAPTGRAPDANCLGTRHTG